MSEPTDTASVATKAIIDAIGTIAERIEKRVDTVERDLSKMLREQQNQLIRLDEKLKNYDNLGRRVNSLEAQENTRQALEEQRNEQNRSTFRFWGLLMSVPSSLIALFTVIWALMKGPPAQ